METTDIKYMERALQLARNGAGFVSPNPMVGAVIVSPEGNIIGEGWHALYGGPHAEVNAVNSVSPENQHLLPQSTIYVTLEPCSHYGKTPPCSKLLIEKRFKRVVIGMKDPFKEVQGRGINMLREAGIEVETGMLEKECRELNRRFITAHEKKRPYIQLKWAQSSDGYIAALDCNANGEPGINADYGANGVRTPLSSPEKLVEMHRERALADAIIVGTNTLLIDNPSLTVRLWPCRRDPRPVVFKSDRLHPGLKVLERDPIMLDPALPLADNMHILYKDYGITSLMVEGGVKILQSFIDANLYDEIRVETAPLNLGSGVPAPKLGVRN